MPDTPLANDPAARSQAGEILPPEQAKPPEQKTPETPSGDQKTQEQAKKPEDQAKPDDKSLLNKDGDKKDDAPQGAPEKYAEFKVPDGYELDDSVNVEATKMFKEMNLSQESAQKLVDFYVAKSTEAAKAPMEMYANLQKEWQDQVKADPEIGGKLAEVRQVIGQALDGLGSPELTKQFREAMDLTGAGNHPAFVKAFYKLAQAAVETRTHVSGGQSPEGQRAPGKGPVSAASAIWPKLPSSSA